MLILLSEKANRMMQAIKKGTIYGLAHISHGFVIYRKVNDVPFYVLILFRNEKRNAIACPVFHTPYIVQCIIQISTQ